MNNYKLSELIDAEDSAWSLILDWVKSARNSVEILPVERSLGEHTLLKLQVTTHSPMGAMALESSGLLIDHGWLRFLGAGGTSKELSLLNWNGLGEMGEITPIKGAFVIAQDVVGGFFAINGGAFPGRLRNIFYLAPDTLKWEDLERSYSDIFYWALHGDLNRFYQNVRWPNWVEDVATVNPAQGFSIYPPLWTQGEAIKQRSQKVVSIYELWRIHTQGLVGQTSP